MRTLTIKQHVLLETHLCEDGTTFMTMKRLTSTLEPSLPLAQEIINQIIKEAQ